MTREERLLIHKKQESRVILESEPLVSELSEGVPIFRATSEGLVEYIRHNDVLYKVVFAISTESVHKTWDEI